MVGPTHLTESASNLKLFIKYLIYEKDYPIARGSHLFVLPHGLPG
jgi:hypothetical protein